jgi:hypothetical protein
MAETTLRSLVGQAQSWLRLLAPPRALPGPMRSVPDGWPERPDLERLDRVRAALEEAAVVLRRDGWTSGGWFSVRGGDGRVRPVTGVEAAREGLLTRTDGVEGACLVGALLRSAHHPDTGTTVADVWACVDELTEAIHGRSGRATRPPGWVQAPAGRHARLRVLTEWNDAPGRTAEQVLDLLEAGIARTIVGACAR